MSENPFRMTRMAKRLPPCCRDVINMQPIDVIDSTNDAFPAQRRDDPSPLITLFISVSAGIFRNAIAIVFFHRVWMIRSP
ncbi:MAG: hypothetical protein WC683_18745 [bacterium]